MSGYVQSIRRPLNRSGDVTHQQEPHDRRQGTKFDVCFTLPYPRTKITGIGRFVSDLSRKLQGFDVGAIVLAPAAQDEPDEESSLRLIGNLFLNFQLGIRTLVAMTRLRRQYHVLHAQHTHPQSLAACLAARVFGKPSVLTLHGRVPTPLGLARRTVHRLSEILTLKLSTEVVAVSAYVSEAFSRYRPDIKLIENGVDTEVFKRNEGKRAEIRNELGIGTELAFLFAGRWVASKGIHLLLKAATSKWLESQRFVVLLLGEADPREPLPADSMLRRSRFPSILRVVGSAAASLPGYLSAADIFVLPSLYEGMPLGLLEALSSGLPALVSDIPVNRMIVEQTGCGWTFRSGESEDLAQAMHKIVVDGVPENFSKRAREVILQSYNLDEEARRYFALYEQLLAGSETPVSRRPPEGVRDPPTQSYSRP